MSTDVDLFFKILEIAGIIFGGIAFLSKMQTLIIKRNLKVDERFDVMETKIKQQDEHLEFQDDQREDIKKQLTEIDRKVGQLTVYDLKMQQLERENAERKEENKLIMRKLDSIFGSMSRLEILINNKANRS